MSRGKIAWLVGLVGTFFALSAACVYADFFVNVFVPQANVANVTAVTASGICKTASDVVTVTFYDAVPAHNLVVGPICDGTLHWNAVVDLSAFNQGVNHVDAVEGANSALNVAWNKDTIPATVDHVYVGGTLTDAHGYVFPAAGILSFDFTSPDVDFGSATCQIDTGSIDDCTSWSYTTPGVVLDGSHTLHIVVSDGANNTNPFNVSFCVTACADTTPPVIAAHATVFATSTDPAGITVAYVNPGVTDNSDPAPSLSCAPLSGTVFAIGDTVVTCTAQDVSLNVASTTFLVRVALLAPAPTPAPAAAPLGNGPPVANPPSAVVASPVSVAPSVPPAAVASNEVNASATAPEEMHETVAAVTTVASNTPAPTPVHFAHKNSPEASQQMAAAPLTRADNGGARELAAAGTTVGEFPWYLWIPAMLAFLALAGAIVWNTYWTRSHDE